MKNCVSWILINLLNELSDSLSLNIIIMNRYCKRASDVGIYLGCECSMSHIFICVCSIQIDCIQGFQACKVWKEYRMSLQRLQPPAFSYIAGQEVYCNKNKSLLGTCL